MYKYKHAGLGIWVDFASTWFCTAWFLWPSIIFVIEQKSITIIKKE